MAFRGILTSSLSNIFERSGISVDTESIASAFECYGHPVRLYAPQKNIQPIWYYGHDKLDVVRYTALEDPIGLLLEHVLGGMISSFQVMDMWAISGYRRLVQNRNVFKKQNIPIVWWTGTMGSFDWLRSQGVLSSLEESVVSKFVVVSHALANEASNNGIPNNKIEIIPPAIDTGIFHPVSMDEKKRLRSGVGIFESNVYCHIGRFDPDRGTSALMGIWEQMQLPDSRLLLMGGSVNDEYYKQYSRRNPSVSIWDFGIPTQVAACMQMSDANILLSVSRSKGEGFSRVLAEGMACNIPSIVSSLTNTSGPRDYLKLGRNAVLVDPFDPASFLDAFNNLPRMRGNSGIRTLEKIGATFPQVAEKWEALYQGLR